MKGHGLAGAGASASSPTVGHGDGASSGGRAGPTGLGEEFYTVYEFDPLHEKTLMEGFLQLTENRR